METNIPCQDAFATRQGDWGVAIAVSDGLGSATRSQEGAAASVEAAVAAAESHLIGGEGLSCETVVVAFESARATLEGLDSTEIRDFACTLIIAVLRDGYAIVGQIGDGGVVGQTPSGPKLISDPGDSEYVDEVEPLTAEDWQGRVRFAGAQQIEVISVFTDGCQRSLLSKSSEGLSPFTGFFDPVFNHVRSTTADELASKDVERLLAGSKMSGCSEDDKTLVIAWA